MQYVTRRVGKYIKMRVGETEYIFWWCLMQYWASSFRNQYTSKHLKLTFHLPDAYSRSLIFVILKRLFLLQKWLNFLTIPIIQNPHKQVTFGTETNNSLPFLDCMYVWHETQRSEWLPSTERPLTPTFHREKNFQSDCCFAACVWDTSSKDHRSLADCRFKLGIGESHRRNSIHDNC